MDMRGTGHMEEIAACYLRLTSRMTALLGVVPR